MKTFTYVIQNILSKYRFYIDHAYSLPEYLISVLLIHASLLNLSYIFEETQSLWVYCLVVLVRPQIALNIPVCVYFTICYLVLHFACIYKNSLPGLKYISVVNSLLKVALLNFIIEELNDLMGLILGAIVLIVQFSEYIFIDGILDINTINFQLTQTTFLSFFTFILNLMLIIFYKLSVRREIIQILALINSVVCQINLLMTQNIKNQFTRLTMMSIQAITFILGIIQLIDFQNTYTLIIVPLCFKLFYQINSKNQTKKVDSIIQASIYRGEEKLFQCLMVLSKIQSEGIIRDTKKKQLMKKCIEQINEKMLLKQEKQSMIGVAEKVFQNDEKQMKITFEIKKVIERKIQLLKLWKKNHFNEIYTLTQQLVSLKNQIDNYYNKLPTCYARSLICFYYAEILNDFLKVNNIILQANQVEQKIGDTVFYSANMYFIIFKYDLGNLMIDKLSSNAPRFLRNKCLQDLIPLGIVEYHHKLVDQFLLTQESIFHRQMNDNYMNKDNSIENIDFSIDLSYITGSVNFICLIQPKINQFMTVVVNKELIITSMSSLFQNMPKIFNLFKIGISINHIIPQIKNIRESSYLQNVQINSQMDQNEEYAHFCDIQITVRVIESNIAYAILSFQNIRLDSQFILYSNRKDSKLDESPLSLPLSIAQEHHELANSPTRTKNGDNLRANLIELGQPPQIFTIRGDGDMVLLQQKIPSDSEKISINIISPRKGNHLFENYQNQSQDSSMMVKNSKYYQKYEFLNKFIQQTPQKFNLSVLVTLLVICLLTQFIFIIIQMTSMNLITFATDIHLLEIKNLIYQPLDLFLVTRWTLYIYNQQRNSKAISQSDYDQISQFSRSNLGLCFQDLYSNLNSFMFSKELQGLIDAKYMIVNTYVDSNKSEQYNVTLRNAISILLNYEYLIQMDYLYLKTASPDSPQIFFSFQAYPILRDIMENLNAEILVQTIEKSKSYQQKILILLITEQICLFIVILALKLTKQQINKRLLLFMNLFQCTNLLAVEQEIKKLKKQQDFLQDKLSFINYNFDLAQKENQFNQQYSENEVKYIQNEKKRKITTLYFNLLIILLYFICSANSVINYVQFDNYFMRYPQTAILKKQLSYLSGNIPLMFAQREVLYKRSIYIYLDSSYFAKILSYIQESLNETQVFLSAEIDYSKILVSQSFQNYYDQILVSDLCLYLPDSMKVKSESLCPTTFNSNMQFGLHSMLIYVVNKISTEMIINNFTARGDYSKNELEGAFLISEVINVINNQYYNDLLTVTDLFLQNQNIFNICYMVFLFLVLLFIVTVIKESQYAQSRIVTKFIYLLPTYSLFNDETLVRTIRILMNF